MEEKLKIKAWGMLYITKKQFFWLYGIILVLAMVILIYFYYSPIDSSDMHAGWKKTALNNITWLLWIYLLGALLEAQFYWNKFTEAQLNIIKEQKIIIEQHKEEVEAQRDEIESQRDMIVEQNKQLEQEKHKIEQSIQYAKRIQKAILRNNILDEADFLDYFLFFRPRDQVSGDFYWTYKSDNKVYMAVSDCTGHGVPGAFLSMLGVAYLNDIVKEFPAYSAAEILNELRHKMINALHQQEEGSDRREGMDIALLIIEEQTKAQFAGANQELICVDNQGLKVIKGDKMPIGIHKKDSQSFVNHNFIVENKMRLYLYTDGFIDQIGGEKKRKYMRKKFREFINIIKDYEIEEQAKQVALEFDTFKRHLAQVDDVSVLGMRYAKHP